MNTSFLISVIIPLYNKEKFISRALDSVCSQTYANLEILVVNDGSTDRSRERVETFEDARIRLIDKENGGVSSARNRGMDEAKGHYIAFLDADDFWYDKHLEILFEGFQQHTDAVMTSNALQYRWEDRADNIQDEDIDKPIQWQNEIYLDSLSRGSFPVHIGSSMFKRDMIEHHNIRFYEHMRLAEDVNFILRISRLGKIIRSTYIGLIYYQDDVQSAMKQQKSTPACVPAYFEGMYTEEWSAKEHTYIRNFLVREYLKKAYQNRHFPLNKKEFTLECIDKNISIGWWWIGIYGLIRFMPEKLFDLYRRYKTYQS